MQKQQSKAEASKAARSPQQESARQEAKEVKIKSVLDSTDTLILILNLVILTGRG